MTSNYLQKNETTKDSNTDNNDIESGYRNEICYDKKWEKDR